MPSVTDWISSVAAIVGSLAGVGALFVSLFSLRRAGQAVAADRATREAIQSAAVSGVAAAKSGASGEAVVDEPGREPIAAVEASEAAAASQAEYLSSLVQNLEKLNKGRK